MQRHPVVLGDDASDRVLKEIVAETLNERYAVLSVPTPGAPAPGHAERKLLGAWTSHPRVREAIKRLCVGAATVVPSAIERAALSIIWALGKPPCPSEAVPTVERGLEFCLGRMRQAGLQLAKPPDLVAYETLRTVSNYFASHPQ